MRRVGQYKPTQFAVRCRTFYQSGQRSECFRVVLNGCWIISDKPKDQREQDGRNNCDNMPQGTPPRWGEGVYAVLDDMPAMLPGFRIGSGNRRIPISPQGIVFRFSVDRMFQPFGEHTRRFLALTALQESSDYFLGSYHFRAFYIL